MATIDIELRGADPTLRRLDLIQRRMLNMEPAFREVIPILEGGEKRHFDRLNGRYVLTGDLRASLTQAHAKDAIRDADRDELTFGSSLYYAQFLKKGKRSAVLVLQPKAKKEVAARLLREIMGPEVLAR